MIKRWVRWFLALGMTLSLAVAVSAQTAGPLMANLEEQKALSDIEENKLVHLREVVQKMLEDPATKDSFQTFYFMGYVLHHAEGDLPRARWYLQEGLKRYEAKHGKAAGFSAPWGWQEKMIIELGMVTGEMDLYEEQMKVWDQLDELFKHEFGHAVPLLQAYYSWPLMKLGREEEARERLRKAMVIKNESSVVTVLNSLGALEMETDHPQACYRAFQMLLQEVRSNGWEMSNTYLRNAGESAAVLLKFDEAEKLFLEATELFDPKSFSNPWWDLSTLYLSQGRFPEAISALKKCHKWTFDSEAHLAQQSWAANQQLTCEIMLQLGLTERAYEIARQFVDRPDRKGGDSVQRDQWEAANMIVFREAALARRQAMQEEMVWSKGWDWWKLLWAQRDLAWEAYVKGQQAASSIVSHGRLLNSMRYAYAPGTVLIPNYLRLELATLLGPGTTLAALDELELRNFENLERERPYLDTIRFEALARLGRNGDAFELLKKIETQLPRSEVLLRARLLARAAEMHLSAGDQEKALPYLQQVMQQAPGLLRNLKIPLPVQFTDDGSPLAANALELCRRSPRFSEAAGAFRVEIHAGGARLLGPDGSVLSTAELRKLTKGQEAHIVLTQAIHDRFFAAPIDMSQLDVSSLDGVVTGGVQSKQMQEMFFPGSTREEEHETGR